MCGVSVVLSYPSPSIEDRDLTITSTAVVSCWWGSNPLVPVRSPPNRNRERGDCLNCIYLYECCSLILIKC